MDLANNLTSIQSSYLEQPQVDEQRKERQKKINSARGIMCQTMIEVRNGPFSEAKILPPQPHQEPMSTFKAAHMNKYHDGTKTAERHSEAEKMLNEAQMNSFGNWMVPVEREDRGKSNATVMSHYNNLIIQTIPEMS